ncbi:MAG: right-handed parallel beta-helix repeat-containing protein [Verrucomicrobia bacterium]|nr:right-handed parallel beta-helix repeat-containing protein [Verrucomicrobiota bacterium]
MLTDVRGATLHVAVNGNDSNPGTQKKPFASLDRAQDAIRKLKKGKPLRDPVTIIVHGGTYQQASTLELTTEDSGTVKNPVLWQAATGEEVRLTGGPVLSANSFKPVTDETILARLDSTAHEKVFQLNLSQFISTDLPEFPKTFRGVPAAPELFFQNQRMSLAHWPNKVRTKESMPAPGTGWATISKIIAQGSVPREGDKAGIPGVFEYSDARPDRWNVEQGVWLQGYWCYDWYEESIRVQSIDREKNQITLAAPALYGVRQGNPSPRRFRALNLLEELDEPGEFYIDRLAGILYFWPPAPLEGAHIALSVLDAPLLLLTNAEHVTFKGFLFEASLGNGIEISGGKSNRIENCTIRNTRLLGIRVVGGAGHRVESCNIHDTGTGGLVLEGGDRKTLTPAHHAALNNHIWQFSRHQLTAAYGLTLAGVGNRAAHNVLHDAPHQAIFINGNDHLFEFNSVSNVVMETDDAGALYKGRNPSCRGNIIRYNFWRDIGSPMGHGTAAIYFDDGDGGDLVFGNIFQRCGYPGGGSFGTIFSHGGHDNRAENNIFIDCGRALGSAPWGDQLWKETVDGGHDCHFQVKLLQEVDITKPPYTTRYPELVGLMNPQPGQARNNFATNNIFIRSREISSGNWNYAAEKMWSTEGDPGFVNFDAGQFQLRSDAEAFKRLPGFVSIPFERIGFEKGHEPPGSSRSASTSGK